MTIEAARKVLSDNYECRKNSFIYSLYEKCCFSVEKFWEYYDSIAVLSGLSAGEKNAELTMQVTETYQRMLKEIIYHFAPDDLAVIDNFPDNYNAFIDRIDLAVSAYFSNNIGMLDDKKFELQRENMDKRLSQEQQ